MPSRSSIIAALFTVIGFTLFWYRVSDHLGGFIKVQYDDAYVTYRYAASLASGDGLRFNVNDPTNSASSLSFTIILAVFALVSGSRDFPLIANFVNLASLFLMMAYVTKYSVYRVGVLVGSATSMLLFSSIIYSGYIGYWAVSGMETVFFFSLSLATVIFFIQRQGKSWSKKNNIFGSALLVILALTRVDGALIAFAIGIVFALTSLGSSNLKSPLAGLIHHSRFMLVAIFTLGFQLIFNLIYYKKILSDPIDFKPLVNYYASSPQAQFDNQLYFLSNIVGPVTAAAAGLLALTLISRIYKKSGLLNFEVNVGIFIFIFLFLYLLRVPNSDEFRYQVTLIVPLLILVLVSSYQLANLTFQNRLPRTFFAIALVGISVNVGVSMSPQLQNLNASTSGLWYVQEARAETGKWLEANTAPGSVVLAGDIGALSYFNPSNFFVDSAGLVNRDLLRVVQSDGDYGSEIMRRQPDFIADTTGGDGITASEYIMDNLDSYYVATKTSVYTSCKSEEMFDKIMLHSSPDEFTDKAYISVAKITWKGCN